MDGYSPSNCAHVINNLQAHAQAKAQQAAAEAHHLDATAQELQVKAQTVAVGTESSLERVWQSADMTTHHRFSSRLAKNWPNAQVLSDLLFCAHTAYVILLEYSKVD